MPLYSVRIVTPFPVTELASWEVEAATHNEAIKICRNKAALQGISLKKQHGAVIRVYKVGGLRAPR